MDKFATFDIEARNWTDFQILGFFDGKDYFEHYSVPSFLDQVLTSKYKSFRIYAHFAGKYDFLFLLEDLMQRDEYQVSIIETGSRIIQMVVKRGNKTWYFRDSFALMSAKLVDLTEAFGVRHKKQEFDHVKGDYLSKKGREYLRNDCFGLYEVIQKYSEWGCNGGKLRATAASQAMYVFRKNFQDGVFYPMPSTAEEFIRKTYYGGRCEIFKMHGKDLFYYDVNSMYPFAMLQPMPTGKIVFSKTYDSSRIGFYEISVTIPKDCKIPYIPFVRDGKLLFPTGTFSAFVTSAEISQLLLDRYSFRILRGYVFLNKERIFKKYVDYFYDLKVKSKKGSVENFIAKLALNSLYGKTGEKRLKETIIKVGSFNEILKNRLKPYHEGLGLYKKERYSSAFYIQPQLASYVTSLARMKLLQIMREAGDVYYCDTDSVITSKKLTTGAEIGCLKEEYRIDEAVFLQPKMYALKLKDGSEVVRMKGFNRQDIPFSKFKSVLFGGNINSISAEVARMEGWKEGMKKMGRVTPRRIIQIKRLVTGYDKRIVNSDFSTSPINI